MSIEKFQPSYDIYPERIDRLKSVVPEAFADGKINWEILKESLGLFADDEDAEKEHYAFTWPGKREARRMAGKPPQGTLVPVPGEGVNEDSTENIFIEGDNLEVLKLLQKSYAGKIKMIYLDPPYNTGKDFVYNDDFKLPLDAYFKLTGQVDEAGNTLVSNKKTDGRFHSKWLNMMYPRLYLAKNLLSDDGVILVSIDDNELCNLRKFLDEIFGEEHFVAQVTIENDSRARQYGSIATTHEYLLIYSKNQDYNYKILSEKDKKFQYEDKDGGFDIYELRNRNVSFNISNRPNLYYPYWVDPKSEDKDGFYQISLTEIEGWVKTYPQESQGVKTVWRWGREKASKNLNSTLVARKHSAGFFQIVKKYRGSTFVYNSVWADKEIKTDKGTLEIKALFDNKKIFDFPKPTELIKRALNIFSDDDSFVLDFFAGSATTAHSVLDLNKQDNSNCKFILIQLPEACAEDSEALKAGYKTIADIGKERIRRVIKKINSDEELSDAKDQTPGFKVFRLQKSHFKEWQDYKGSDVKELMDLFAKQEDSLAAGWRPENLILEVMLQEGFPLHSKIEPMEAIKANKVVQVKSEFCQHVIFICLDEKIDKKTIEQLPLTDKDIFICLDKALTDEQKVALSDKGVIKTI